MEEDKLSFNYNSRLDKKIIFGFLCRAFVIGRGYLVPGLITSNVIASSVPVVGWITGGVGLLYTVIYAFKDKIGIWNKKTSKKVISKCLFEVFLMEKNEILKLYINSFNDLIQKAFEELKSQKEFD